MGQDASANLDPLTENINVKKTGTVSLIQLFTVVRTDTTLDLSQKAEKVSTQRRREEKEKKKDPKKKRTKGPPTKVSKTYTPDGPIYTQRRLPLRKSLAPFRGDLPCHALTVTTC